MRLLVALGGNAIKQADEVGTTAEQFANCDRAAADLASIVAGFGPDDWMAITHGNGPQSGNLSVQMEAAKDLVPVQTLDVIGAMTQGQIGYMLQNTLQKHLKARGLDVDVDRGSQSGPRRPRRPRVRGRCRVEAGRQLPQRGRGAGAQGTTS